MSQILAPGSGITIEAGGQVLAHAAGYSVKMSRACVAVWPYGSTEPLTLLPGSTAISYSWSRSGGRRRRIIIQ